MRGKGSVGERWGKERGRERGRKRREGEWLTERWRVGEDEGEKERQGGKERTGRREV